MKNNYFFSPISDAGFYTNTSFKSKVSNTQNIIKKPKHHAVYTKIAKIFGIFTLIILFNYNAFTQCTGLNIGDTYGGGKVAYILQSGDPGYEAGKCKGLIAAPTDQSTAAPWGCGGTLIGGTSTLFGSGATNTAAIVGGCPTAGIAARICDTLTLNGYTDWYLPSLDELNKLYLNKTAIGGFSNTFYWCSSESDINYVYKVTFVNGTQQLDVRTQTFYVRAIRSFEAPCNGISTVSDNDGNSYNVVAIGTQCWFAKNLTTTKYRTGNAIEYPGTNNTAWENNTTGAYAWYNNDIGNKATYGALYNWNAATNGSKLCPPGWKVPTDAELTTLTTYLGGESVAGGKLKETGTTHWGSPNTGATNETGFTALPGGYRGNDGAFDLIGNFGYWWSSTEYVTHLAWYRSLYYLGSTVGRSYDDKKLGFSVRCLRDFDLFGNLTISGNLEICQGASTTLTAEPGATATYLWSPGNQTTAAITVSPSVTTTYTVTVTNGGDTESISVVVKVNPTNTANLTSGAGSDNQTVTEGNAIANITYSTTGATGIGSPTGLPTGVTASWAADVITISGTPTTTGTFNYSIPLTGGCGSVNATGTITVEDNPCGVTSSVTFNYNGSSVTYGTVASQGRCWLDRNLGAIQVATSSTDANAYGDLFQWGRLVDGHQIRTSSTTATLSTTDSPGHGNFITSNASPYDWRNPKNDNLWQGVSGINNPCPAGWRIPTDGELDAERASWGTQDPAGAFSSSLKLPIPGYRFNTDGTLNFEASQTYYWSSTVDGVVAKGLRLYSGFAGVSTFNRANACPVRCIKDDCIPNTITLTSALGTNAQTVTQGTAITNITYATTGATGIGTPTGLPTGVNASWTSNVLNIYGTPTTTGTFNYSIPLTGGCGSVNATGIITVNANPCSGISTVSDNDGNSYNVVAIGTQCWFAKNLATTKYRTGQAIDYPGTNNTAWQNNTTGAYAWHNNDIGNKATYGALYNWHAAANGSKLCPLGWKVPTIAEYETLFNFVGTTENERYLALINNGSSGFNGLFGGWRYTNGSFYTIGNHGYWWTSSEYNTSLAWGFGIYSISQGIIESNDIKEEGFSIRCIKDNTTFSNLNISGTYEVCQGASTTLTAEPGATATYLWSPGNQTTAAITVSPSVTTTYTVTVTNGGDTESISVVVKVNPTNTANLTSGAGSDNQTVTEGTAIANITYSTTGATGIGSPTGLPTGVNASWTSNVLNIYGTPTTTGTFNYSIPLTGGCGSVNATGIITVNPSGGWICGQNLIITHTGGIVAPETKTVTYGTVQTSLSGASKCWLTQNLGASQQASAANDNTETSAGWYWQFNRKQGYKNAGTVIPSWTITDIDEASNWNSNEDPCSILLGAGWRIPTYTEWNTVDGSWSNSGNAYNSVLKLHDAGFLNRFTGAIEERGTAGKYWSSSQGSSVQGHFLDMGSSWSLMTNDYKPHGYTLRCIKDDCTVPDAPSTITGQATQCINATGQTFSITAVSGANDYTWSVPSGWTITSGVGTTSITVTIGNTNGNITVTANNACGSSAPATLSCTVHESVGGTAASNQTISINTQPADLVLTGHNGAILWQYSADGVGGWTNISGATSPTLSGSLMGPLSASRWYRAQVTNSPCPEQFSNIVSITVTANPCSGLTTITDADNNVYDVVAIGEQCWLKQNLKTTKFRTGQNIPYIPDNTTWSNLIKGAFTWYNNDVGNKATYGALYNWYTTVDGNGLCPTGWRVPTDAEWTILTTYLGGLSVAGGKLKETGTIHWNAPNTGATNETDFTALPGSYRYDDGTFDNIGEYGLWWSSTGSTSTTAVFRMLDYSNSGVNSVTDKKTYGLSIRCLRDNSSICPPPTMPGTITGPVINCPNVTGLSYSINSVPYAVSYNWTVPSGWAITFGQGDTLINVTAGSGGQNGNITVTAQNVCDTSAAASLAVIVNNPLPAPTAGTHTTSPTQIIWHWNPVNGALGYKYNTVNDYSSAIDITTNTTYTQTGLSCGGVSHTLYVWAYGPCGASAVVELTALTDACPAPYCGTKVWTFGNINFGSRIDGSVSQTNNSLPEKYCYNDVEANCDLYGGLYQWGEALMYSAGASCDPCGPTIGNGGIKGICPIGYHIPSDLEWSRYEWCVENNIVPTGTTSLSLFQGGTGWRGSNTAGVGPGDKMKVTNAFTPSWDGTNTSGFTALPAGELNTAGTFGSLGASASFWSATENGANAWSRNLGSSYAQIYRLEREKTNAYSVRCLKDSCLVPPAVITAQPVNSTICEWENTSFSTVATGTSLTYQWQISTDGGNNWSNLTNGAPYSGVDSDELSITNAPGAMDGFRYRCAISTTCGLPTLTSPVVLSVNTPPDIIWQPTNTSACDSASATISVVATGTNLTYQWQVSTNGGTSWTNISNNAPYSGATTANLVVNPVTSAVNNNKYKVIISGVCSQSISSIEVLLNIGSGNTLTLTSGTGSNQQGVCLNQPMTPITYAVIGSTTASFTGLPNGVTGSLVNGVISINGFPSAIGTFNYTVTLTGGCGLATETGIITVYNNTPAPYAQSATNIMHDGFTAKWTAVQGTNVTYRLDVSLNASFTNIVPAYNDLDVLGVTSYDVTGLNCNLNYFYRVRAIRNGCLSNNSFTILVNTATCPCPVEGQILGGSAIVAYRYQPGDPGYDPNECQCLITTLVDLTEAEWGCSGSTVTTSTDLGTGMSNTNAILSACTDVGIAAELAGTHVIGAFSDWVLPSKDELEKLYIKRAIIGPSSFTSTEYWSSSQDNLDNAWAFDFDSGTLIIQSKDDVKGVRPVRFYTPPPSPSLSSDTVCYQDTVVYKIPPVAGANGYTWEYSGSYISLAQNGLQCELIPTGDGILSVTAYNDCGASVERVLEVIVYHYGSLIWIGLVDDNWFDAINWSPPLQNKNLGCELRIPGPNTHVTIKPAVPYQPVIDFSRKGNEKAECASILIDSMDVLTFVNDNPLEGNTLDIYGDLLLKGKIIFNNDSNLIVMKGNTGEIVFNPDLAKALPDTMCQSCIIAIDAGKVYKVAENDAHAKKIILVEDAYLEVDEDLVLSVFDFDIQTVDGNFKLKDNAWLHVAGEISNDNNGTFNVASGNVYYNNGSDIWDSIAVSQVIIPADYNFLKANGGNVDSSKVLTIGNSSGDVECKTFELRSMGYPTSVMTASNLVMKGDGDLKIGVDDYNTVVFDISTDTRIYDVNPVKTTNLEMGDDVVINIYYTHPTQKAIDISDDTLVFLGTVNYKGADEQVLIDNTYKNLGLQAGPDVPVKMYTETYVTKELSLSQGRLHLNRKTLNIMDWLPESIVYTLGYIYAEDVPVWDPLDPVNTAGLASIDNIVKWHIKEKADSSVYTVPFGIDEGKIIPMSLLVSHNDMDISTGYVRFSTYGTPTGTGPTQGDNLPRPPGVDHLGFYNDGGLINDRYWFIDYKPSEDKAHALAPIEGKLTFTFVNDELDGVLTTGMMAQRYNPNGGHYDTLGVFHPYGVWADVLFTTNPVTSMPVYGGSEVLPAAPGLGKFKTSLIDSSQFYNIWVLTNEQLPLPITLLYFKGECLTNKVELTWKTGTETNNDFFTVERSKDGVIWYKVADVNGAGNSSQPSNYSLIDYASFSGVSYYRLSQTDLDGNVEYIGLAVVSCHQEKEAGLFIYPNPFSSNITIEFVNLPATDAQLLIYDAIGRVVAFKDISSIESGTGSIVLDLSHLANGVYNIKFISEEFVRNEKITKQK